jgi:hypothetical protein
VHPTGRPRFLIQDRDTKFSRAFDAVFHGERVRVIRTPIQAPNANAHVERWVGSVRRECLDRLLIFSRSQLDRVVRVYVRHYTSGARTKRYLQAPDPLTMPSTQGDPLVSRRCADAICSADLSTNMNSPQHEIELMHPTTGTRPCGRFSYLSRGRLDWEYASKENL